MGRRIRGLLPTALAALNGATGGASCERKDNWPADRPFDAWRGVTTDDNGRITELGLGFNGSGGPIPSKLGNLASLEEPFLGGNELCGCIPAGLTGMRTSAQSDLGLSTCGG